MVMMLLSDLEYDIKNPIFIERKKYYLTNIQKMVINDENWIDFMPKSMYKKIKKLNDDICLNPVSKANIKSTKF